MGHRPHHLVVAEMMKHHRGHDDVSFGKRLVEQIPRQEFEPAVRIRRKTPGQGERGTAPVDPAAGRLKPVALRPFQHGPTEVADSATDIEDLDGSSAGPCAQGASQAEAEGSRPPAEEIDQPDESETFREVLPVERRVVHVLRKMVSFLDSQ